MLKREVPISLVDAHCHVDLYTSYEDVLADSDAADVRVLAVTTTPHAYTGNLKRFRQHRQVVVALGIHPQIVGTKHADLSVFDSHLSTAVAVGEVGLDGSARYTDTYAEQQNVFSHVVRACADAGGRPMTVHSLRAVRRVLELMRENDANCVNRYALHWFTGSTDELRAAIDFGCFFSVNQAMTKSRRGLQLLALVPSARVFTETDGPFILDGRQPLVPSGVAKVTVDIANAWNVDFDSARQTIAQNFQRFLG